MAISIYIATQEEHEFPGHPAYRPILVGNAGTCPQIGLNDRTGDSISEKNPLYCELTGHYWIWKNDRESDIVGLCHYRRYLWLNDIPRGLCRRAYSSVADCARFLDTKSLGKMLERRDAILPRGYAFSSDDIKAQFIRYHGPEHYELMVGAIGRVSPEYLGSVDRVFGRRWVYFANLLVAGKALFDDYSAWLFAVLEEVERHLDPAEKKNARILGFMGERLLNLYVAHNGLDVVEVPQIYITEGKEDGGDDLHVDARYVKRRYFPGLLTLEERVRKALRR